LFGKIEKCSKWLVSEGKPQEVANAAWACATPNIEAPSLFAEVNDKSKWLVDCGNPQDVANAAWAFAKLDCQAPRLFDEIEKCSKWLVSKGNSQDLANTAWAFATLGYQAPTLFAEIDNKSKQLVDNGTSQAVANTALAFATLGYEAPKLFAEIDRNVDSFLKTCNVQTICNTCYAITVLGLAEEYESTLMKLWGQSIQLFVAGNYFEDEDLVQLTQALLFANTEGVHLQQIPEPMLIQQQLAVERTDDTVSRASMAVSQLLKEIGFDHEVEVAPNDNAGQMLAIDFACTKQKVAIEYDGASHYLKAVQSGVLTRIKNGPTKAKLRFLERLGWTVINLDFRDHMEAKRVSKEKEWLVGELRKSGVET